MTLQAVDSATFVSLLFTRVAVENKGLPVKEYFIWGDDKEYTLRISETYPCYHVKESVAIHKMKTNAGSNIVIDDIERVPRYFMHFVMILHGKKAWDKRSLYLLCGIFPKYAAHPV